MCDMIAREAGTIERRRKKIMMGGNTRAQSGRRFRKSETGLERGEKGDADARRRDETKRFL